ncbi:MAG: hypothetical protein CMO01_10525 [Thalassobius sp.]|nr:hypothetical protein [Thalassovita sp.]
MKALNFKEAMEVLQNRETFLNRLSDTGYKPGIIFAQVILIFCFTFFYGVIMGSYNSLPQALATGLKLWLLIMMTLIICFPSFYIVQLILGSKIKIGQLFIILLAGFVMLSITMLAFAPIVLFFQLSGDNYHFLQLLHVFVFGFSGVFGMKVVLDALTAIFEGKEIYPKIGLIVFKIWVIIFAFVGIQLSWNMRPFVGTKDMPFQLFRTETRGNFYQTVFSSIGSLLGIEKDKKEPVNFNNENMSHEQEDMADSLKKPAPDTIVKADSIDLQRE